VIFSSNCCNFSEMVRYNNMNGTKQAQTLQGEINYSVYRDVFTNKYYTTLLGGEFSNCHGQGRTEDEAVRGLKMRIYQLRRKKSVV